MEKTQPYLSVYRPQTHYQKQKAVQAQQKGISENQLVFIGVASILGAGFFLATAGIIRDTGFSILLAYLIGLFVVWTVFDALGEMLVTEPGHAGSFLFYAEKHLGRAYGFVGGWLYWIAGIFIMSSEVTAIGLFTQKWLPSVPIWLLSTIYAVLALGINLIGMKNYGKVESLFAAVKIAALVLFIVIVVGVILFGKTQYTAPLSFSANTWFTHGVLGLLSSLSVMSFTFGGIASTGMASAEIEDVGRIPTAFRKLVALLGILYLGSLALVLFTTPIRTISERQSPFVTTLMHLRLPYADHILNAVMITAAFSTMTATMFAVSRVLVNLSHRHEAPASLARLNRKKVPIKALWVSVSGLFLSILASYFLPNEIYELLTTAAGINLILKWGLILWSHHHFRQEQKSTQKIMWGYPWKNWLSLGIIAITLIGTTFSPTHRISLFVSLGLAVFIALIYFFIRHRLIQPANQTNPHLG